MCAAGPDCPRPAPQIMKYAEQRIPTLNEYCVVCDEQHVFQNGSMLKVGWQGRARCGLCPRVTMPGTQHSLSPPQPAVCTRELCVFSFYTLGVMSGAAEEVATGAEVGLGTVETPPAPRGVVPSVPALPQGGGPAGGHVPCCPRVPSQEHHLRALPVRGGPQRPQNSGLQPQGER